MKGEREREIVLVGGREGSMDLSKGAEVCVTGGTGYIASCLIQALLQRGYKVRTTARNPDDRAKTGFLWELPGATERLEIVGAELLEEGTFDEAVHGVHTVFHTACPVVYDPNGDPEVSMLNPALKGNLNVLRACTKSHSIQRVVMTSSCSAIRYDHNRRPEDPPLSESVWSSPEYCRDHKMWYALAKTLAEKEAFEFAAREGLNLVVICPSFVIGPSLTPIPTSTVFLILDLLRGRAQEYPNKRIGFVHIDDVVTAHVLAMEVPEAHGRYICSSDVAHFGDIMSMLKTKYPKLQTPTRCSDMPPGDDIHHKMDTTKIKKLGLTEFKSIEQMFDDMLRSLHEKHLESL